MFLSGSHGEGSTCHSRRDPEISGKEKRFWKFEKERILTVCGSGNNGGDGIAIARLLHLAGIRSEIYLAGNPDKMTEETRHQWDIAMSYQVPVMNNPVWDEYTVIVDGIFGVGLSRRLPGITKR